MSHNTIALHVFRQRWRRRLSALPWCVCFWWRWLLVAVGSQGPPSLRYTGLWRATGGCWAHQRSCESNQVSVTDYVTRFVYCVRFTCFYSHSPTSCRFSTDEGQCWHTYNFTSDPLHFSGMDSEPGSRSMNVSLWGYRNDFSKWVVITIDFRKLFNRDCEYEGEFGWWLVGITGSHLK